MYNYQYQSSRRSAANHVILLETNNQSEQFKLADIFTKLTLGWINSAKIATGHMGSKIFES